MLNKCLALFVPCLTLLALHAAAQDIQLLGIVPGANQNHVSRDANIVISFDQSIDPATVNSGSIIVTGSQSGRFSGSFSGGGSSTISFDAQNNFRPGETVAVTITTALLSGSGQSLARGFSYTFGVASGPPASTPLLLAERSFSVASPSGRAARALDFDGDGDMDILTSNEGVPEQLIVFENDGNMNFCGFSTGGNFRNIEVYDIDGDGDYDNFGATGAFDQEINWFENQGTSPFTERFISSEDAWTLAGGDIDSDGDVDLVAAVILPNRLLWFANNGDATFAPAISIPTTFSGGSDSYFYVRDINSDGAMDILAFHRDDRNLVWYQNNGNQIFSEILIANTTDRMRLTSGDIDDDGDADIIAVSTDGSPVNPFIWYENDGSENFSAHPIPVSSTGRLYNLHLADVDGDMDMDILAAGYWFENDGSENFTEHAISEGLRVGNNYSSNGIDCADMDGDGDMDIVTIGINTSWHENGRSMAITATSPHNAASSVASDANISISFDQPVDFATVNSSSIPVVSKAHGTVAGVYSSGPANTVIFDPLEAFSPGDLLEVSVSDQLLSTAGHSLPVNYGFSFYGRSALVTQPGFVPHSVATHASNASGVDIADMDGDGDPDLVSCSFGELFWHQNDGNGIFTTFPIAITGTPVGVFAFDQNSDGHTDIWVNNDGSALNSLYLNDGNQNFSEQSLLLSLPLRQVSDVNHDGNRDLIFTTRIDNWVGWLENRCEGYSGLGTVPRFASRDLQAADMDNDGDVDFVTAALSGPLFYENNGYFIYSTQVIDNNSTIALTLADLDNDGDADPLLVENFSAIIWYENRLTGDSLDFAPRREIGVLNQDPRDVLAVDIDGDGDADVAAVSRNDDKVVWYENRLNEPTADFGPANLLPGVADAPLIVRAADIDMDGDMDLITLSDGDDELNWFENTGTPVAIDEPAGTVPLAFSLEQNYPNPFNPVTLIRFALPAGGRTVIQIYNLHGQHVQTLSDGYYPAGWHEIKFDGNSMASGVYFYKLKSGDNQQVRKMILLR